MIIETGRSKHLWGGGVGGTDKQAGVPGQLMLHFQFKGCQAGEPGRADVTVLVQQPTAGESPYSGQGGLFALFNLQLIGRGPVTL